VKRALILAASTLALAGPAEAASLNELALREVPQRAVCVRATGVPGELVRWEKGGMALMRATAAGLADAGHIPFGTLGVCPEVAGDPSGATVLAVPTENGIRVVTRAPGAGWSAPETIPNRGYPDLSAAVSARGDVALAWLEATSDDYRAYRVRTALRAAGAAAFTVQTLATYDELGFEGAPAVGLDAQGAATLLFQHESGESSGMDTTYLTSAPPGGRFAQPAVFARTKWGGAPALAVAPDGRALAVIGDMNDLSVYERPPGGAFGKSRSVFDAASPSEGPAVALRPDGAAVIAFQQGGDDPLLAVVRDGPTEFGPLLRSQLKLTQRRLSFGQSIGAISPGSVPYENTNEMRIAFGADGRALITYPTSEDGLVATTLSSAGVGETQLLGSPLRDPLGLTPLLLADGTRAVAWSDNRAQLGPGPMHGRLHFAVEGAPALTPPPVQVTVGKPRPSAVRPSESFALPIRCSAACDLRAHLPGVEASSDETATLTKAGVATLHFRPAESHRLNPLRITLKYGAPGTGAPGAKTIKVTLKRLPAPPLPHIVNARATRSGNHITVRWDTDLPTRYARFAVYGLRTRKLRFSAGMPYKVREGNGRRHFQVRLKAGKTVRFIRLELFSRAEEGHASQTLRVVG